MDHTNNVLKTHTKLSGTYVPFMESAVLITGKPVAITVIAISPFIYSSTKAPKMMLAFGSTASYITSAAALI